MSKIYISHETPTIKNKSYRRKIYTIHKNAIPLIAQYSTTKSSIVSFIYKSHAIRFAYFIESYYYMNRSWPQLNTNNIISQYKNENVDEYNLNILDIHQWENESLNDYCKNSICDFAILKENTSSSQDENCIIYTVQLCSIDSSLEDQINRCNKMYIN